MALPQVVQQFGLQCFATLHSEVTFSARHARKDHYRLWTNETPTRNFEAEYYSRRKKWRALSATANYVVAPKMV